MYHNFLKYYKKTNFIWTILNTRYIILNYIDIKYIFYKNIFNIAVKLKCNNKILKFWLIFQIINCNKFYYYKITLMFKNTVKRNW